MTLRVRARCCLEGAGTDSRPAILVARVCMFVCVGAYRVVSWSRAHALIDFLFFFLLEKNYIPKQKRIGVFMHRAISFTPSPSS